MNCKWLLLTAALLVLFVCRSAYGAKIWHYGEIPYEPNARCLRGMSYYTNDNIFNNTYAKDILGQINSTGSLVTYTPDVECHFCICHTSGWDIACIPRRRWVCDYYRRLARPGYMRYVYSQLFKQDRPAYFRTLSYRLRRTLDLGIYDLVETGGDALCCDHPDGHVKRLHKMMKSRMRSLRNKVPKEDLFAKESRGDYVDFIVNND